MIHRSVALHIVIPFLLVFFEILLAFLPVLHNWLRQNRALIFDPDARVSCWFLMFNIDADVDIEYQFFASFSIASPGVGWLFIAMAEIG